MLLCSGFPPAAKLGSNQIEVLPYDEVVSDDVIELLEDILLPHDADILEKTNSVDFAYELFDEQGLPTRRFRCNAYLQRNGMSVVFRAIPSEPPTIEDLSLPTVVKKITQARNGLVLITGPTGAGKSSTLAAMARYINENRKVHLITIEDPIEYIHRNINAMVVQRQVGVHVESFQRALLSALREDPDVIIVGELREPETIQLAMTAAETGHLVMATLHTISASHTITRIINSFPSHQQSQIRVQLADSLRAVVSQQLVTRLDGYGSVPAVEILLQNEAVSNVIRENKIHQLPGLIEIGRQWEMNLMDDSLLGWVRAGVIDPGEALAKSHNQIEFTKRMEEWQRSKGVL